MMKDTRHEPNTFGLIQSKDHPAAYKMPKGFGHYFASPNDAYWGMISVIMFLKDLSDHWQRFTRPFGITLVQNSIYGSLLNRNS